MLKYVLGNFIVRYLKLMRSLTGTNRQVLAAGSCCWKCPSAYSTRYSTYSWCPRRPSLGAADIRTAHTSHTARMLQLGDKGDWWGIWFFAKPVSVCEGTRPQRLQSALAKFIRECGACAIGQGSFLSWSTSENSLWMEGTAPMQEISYIFKLKGRKLKWFKYLQLGP